jgi:hypothetical protein
VNAFVNSHLRSGKRVWVSIRARPELEQNANVTLMPTCVTFTGDEGWKEEETFFFDRVFDGSATQCQVWSSLQPQLMRCMLRREHACLFAYGQTGSGKTHTMFGNPDVANEEGIAFRAIQNVQTLLMREVTASGCPMPTVEFSFLEVYNEKVHDLLDHQRLCQLSEERVMLKAGDKTHAPTYSSDSYVVPNVKRVSCDIDDLVEQVGLLLQEGAASRMVGKTVFNPRSSRSHAIATLHINWQEHPAATPATSSTPASSRPASRLSMRSASESRLHAEEDIESSRSLPSEVAENGTASIPKQSISRHAAETRLYLVDLAGSERAGQYALSADQLKEGVNINQSLSTLGRVVGSLARGKGDHVPYRDSVLTWLLSDAITGRNARAFMVAAVQPKHPAETLSTLRYAHAYSTLQSDLSTRIPKLKAQVRQLQQRRESLVHQFDSLCLSYNMNSRGQTWDRSTLEEKHVKVRRSAKELFAGHPYLRWTESHDGKLQINAMGIVRDVCSVPPAREQNDVPDGRRRIFEEVAEGAHYGNVVKLIYEGRHGFPATQLWYPEGALENIRPPEEMVRLLSESETAGASLAAKQKQLRDLEMQFREQRQHGYGSGQ